MRRICLASESPRRRELMNMTGIPFFVSSAKIEEKINPTLDLKDAVADLAKQKALAVFEKYPNEIIVAADTVVVIDNEVLGKPKNEEDARRMLEMLSNRNHQVITGVAILSNTIEDIFYEVTDVKFGNLSQETIDWYISTKEYYDKAGGYAIQGKGILLVEKIDGDYSNVVGLPMHKLINELRKFIEM